MTDITQWGLREQWHPGDRAHFEYQCWESPDSNDADAWYHSHQMVTVLDENVDDGQRVEFPTYDDRADAGMPVTYSVRFDDGLIYTVFEYELMTDSSHFERPDPPVVKS
jgi:hypothetical protein